MRARTLVLIGVAVGLAVIAAIAVVLLSDRRAPAPLVEIGRTENQAKPPPSRVEGALGVESRAAELSTSKPKPLAETDEPAPEPDPLRVLVIEEATGMPVPGAEVAWRDDALDGPRPFGLYATPPSVLADLHRAPNHPAGH